MNAARTVGLANALSAGGVAAYLARGSDEKPAAAEPVAQLPTTDILIAKSGIGLGQSVNPGDLQWQTWTASSSSNSFIGSDDHAPKRGSSINVVRYGIASQSTAQK
ncbi:hypothetical protein JQ629_24065 [Bradyrhizobium sp. AUGA SZCCT0222]|uniref:hypothetical protein n=1 Tax=Bradyrhizobium sp. AUGA SZCCT0222 TaxID=2807668 RepID=UPI001BAD02F9|nr:hypothetical protein [Bradyrhizobium sp. AUGA SZCCT0222]